MKCTLPVLPLREKDTKMLHAHETSLTWKDTNIFNNANLCTPKNVAKNNDHAASVVALVHTHTNILADHVTRSIS